MATKKQFVADGFSRDHFKLLEHFLRGGSQKHNIFPIAEKENSKLASQQNKKILYVLEY